MLVGVSYGVFTLATSLCLYVAPPITVIYAQSHCVQVLLRTLQVTSPFPSPTLIFFVE